jgi:hypothetical protein
MAVLRCLASFAFTETDGGDRVYAAGDLVDSNDPAVKGREDLFEPVEATIGRYTNRRVVEQATAAPGEKRAAKSTKTAAAKG